MRVNMFCYQCEQTAGGTGCTAMGVCGKDPRTAALQDLLIHAAKGISMYAHRARDLGAGDREMDVFTVEALFSTVTNVNFDPRRLEELVRRAGRLRGKAERLYQEACRKKAQQPEPLAGPAAWQPAADLEGLIAQGQEIGIAGRKERRGDDVVGLQELLTYGLKGMAAYADHAMVLGREDDQVYAFFHEALDLLTRDDVTVDQLVAMNLRCGEVNLKVMGLLDAANTGAYGDPVPTRVRVEPLKGKAILVSGHDLKDLEALLQQTLGKGINVYTHGEMLPAHGYPGLKKYGHLAGNYGGAWQDQRKEFDRFPGAILMTTNCIQKPKDSYKDRIFTTGLVAWPGVVHIGDRDFSPVIEAALAAVGFSEDGPDKTIMVGFGHAAVMGVADKVVAAVKSGAIRHFFLIGGCDGAKSGRNYYTEFAQALPEDTVIFDPGLRQVPLQQAGFRRYRRHPALVGRGAVQRRLLGHPDRSGPGRGVRHRCEQPASVPDPLLVRAEGRLHPADLAPPGYQEHPPGPQPAGLRHPRGAQGAGGQFQHHAHLDGRRGYQGDPGVGAECGCPAPSAGAGSFPPLWMNKPFSVNYEE